MLPTNGAQGRDVLHRAEAVERAARIRGVRYALDFDLAEDRSTYAGHARIDVELQPSQDPLFLDFRGRATSLRVNGRPLEPDQRDHRLWLPADLLSDATRVEVEYENEFDVTGDGFHHFVDPEDGATYLYTNFEPFAAHRLFPCFDQPDLKARFELTVSAPGSWTVVSAEAAARTAPLPDGRRRHEFPPTAPFSTYLFPLVAGPYERVEGRHGDLVLGVLGRRSMRRESGALGGRAPRGHGSGHGLLRGAVRPAIPVRQVRPALRAGVQRGRHGERRRRHLRTTSSCFVTRRRTPSA